MFLRGIARVRYESRPHQAEGEVMEVVFFAVFVVLVIWDSRHLFASPPPEPDWCLEDWSDCEYCDDWGEDGCYHDTDWGRKRTKR